MSKYTTKMPSTAFNMKKHNEDSRKFDDEVSKGSANFNDGETVTK